MSNQYLLSIFHLQTFSWSSAPPPWKAPPALSPVALPFSALMFQLRTVFASADLLTHVEGRGIGQQGLGKTGC